MKLVVFCGLTVDAMPTIRDFGFPVDANVDELHRQFALMFNLSSISPTCSMVNLTQDDKLLPINFPLRNDH